MSKFIFASSEHADLWQRISLFQFDPPGTKRTFSQRLAVENGWTANFTDRVIEEYRRFLFLSVVTDHIVTPAEEVDQVWHMHICYTKSYWQELCQEVLGRPLHHNPSLGGDKEFSKYRQCYLDTLESYESCFGSAAPIDIWPTVDKRFEASDYKRVDYTKNFVVRKSTLATMLATGVGALLLAGCASVAVVQSSIPIPVIVIGVIILLVIISCLSKGGKGGRGGRGGGGCGASCGSSCGSSCGGGCGGD
ncbi:MAG: glycine-rich domain-containing protein [Opitutaceae bacterium]